MTVRSMQLNPSADSTTVLADKVKAWRYGKAVTVQVNGRTVEKVNTWTQIATLPAGWRPTEGLYGTAFLHTISQSLATMFVGPEGQVLIRAPQLELEIYGSMTFVAA